MALLTLDGLHLSFGGVTALAGVSMGSVPASAPSTSGAGRHLGPAGSGGRGRWRCSPWTGCT